MPGTLHARRFGAASRLLGGLAAILLLVVWPSSAAGADPAPGTTTAPEPPQRIVFGADREYPPFEYADAAGVPTGFNIELLQAVAEELGWTAGIRMADWPQVRRAVEVEHTVDVATMYRTPTRSVALEFSDPFVVVYFEIVVRRGTPPINSLADLRGRTVVVQDAAFVQEQLLRMDAGAKLIAASSDPEALRWVAAGRYDCAIVEQVGGRYSIRKDKHTNLVASGVPILPVEYCFVVAPGRTQLRTQLNQGLAALRASGRYDRLHRKWFGEFLERPATFRDVLRYAAWILGPLAALALAATGWSLILRRLVARRTAELRTELVAHAQAEVQLREQNSLLKAVTEGTSDAVFVKDRNGRYRMINPAGARFLGLLPETVLGRDDSTLFSADSAAGIMKSDREVMESGNTLTVEEFATAAGVTRAYHVTKAPWRDAQGAVIGIVGVSRDITDLKRTEAKHRQLADERRIVLDTITTGIAFLKDRKHEWANPAFARIFGYQPEELKGMDSAAFYASRADYERVGREGYPKLAAGGIYSSEVEMQRRDGTRIWCQITGHAIDPRNLGAGSIWALHDITERKRAETALKGSEAAFRGLFEAGPIAVGLLVDRKFQRVNALMEKITGYSQAELLGQSTRINYADDAEFERVGRELYRQVEQTGAGTIETRHRRKNGEIYDALICISTLDSKDPLKAAVATVSDITERKRAEAALKESEAAFRSLFEASPIPICLLKDRTFRRVNALMCKTTGYAEADLLGRTSRILYPDTATFEKVGRDLYGQMQHERVSMIETRMQRRDGQIIEVLLGLSPLDPDDPSKGEAVSILDMTPLNRAERQYRTVIQTAVDGFWILDTAGRILDVNDAICRLLGYSRDELLALSIPAIEAEETPEAVAEHLAKIARTGLERFETRLRAKDGRIVDAEIGINYMRRDNDRFFVFIRDITQRKAAESEIHRLNAELEQRVRDRTAELARRVAEVEKLNTEQQALNSTLCASQDDLARVAASLQESNANLLAANQELESFSYSVSHDLRSPLRNIAGFIELLRKRTSGQLDSEADRYFGIVGTEAVRMGALIDDLLTFSRIGRAELHFAPVQLASLVAEVQSELETDLAGRQIEWRIQPLPTVLGDRTLLRQVVANLVSNAVKFTRRRTPAAIEIGTEPAAPGSEFLSFYVRDNGAGFDPKYAAKLFGVFQRLHNPRDFEGTGIGLANVRRIVERHGGRVWAEGQPDKGATFHFSLRPAQP